jgi:hypothetical protein
MLRPLIGVALAGVLVACGATERVVANPTLLVAEAHDAGFELRVTVPDQAFNAGQPIDLRATLTWVGSQPTTTTWGRAGDAITFRLVQTDGTLEMGGLTSLECEPREFDWGKPVEVPFRRSGSWSAADPNAAFYQSFFGPPGVPNKDPLSLPAGRWQITGIVRAYLAECRFDAPRLELLAPLEIVVH